MRLCNLLIVLITSVYAIHLHAEPQSLEELLQIIKQEHTQEKKEFAERENKFRLQKDKQLQLLEEAKLSLLREEKRGERLRGQYDKNEYVLKKQQEILKDRMGSLGELHGIVRQIAGDIDVIIDSSLVSVQKPDRDEVLDLLSSSKELPAIKQLEELWLLTMDELVESGKVVKFPAKIITVNGDEVKRDAVRVGVFNAVSGGNYLRNLPETGKLIEPGRQPSQRFRDMAMKLEQASTGMVPFPIDPTRGAMLALLVQTPDLKARIEQGGLVGYIIIAIGIIGLLIALERFIVLTITDRKVHRQLKSKKPGNNPLGRIMQVHENNPDVDTETLGLKLDEAILKELPAIQRGLGTLSLLAAVAPLLGLLGTVTGIIETFQSITLFGTGDPRVMSGGISQALVTTVMGLLVAIPLLLLHSFLSAKSNQLIQILDEKSLAFVALLAEINRIRQNV